jgi:hypothetical protein
MKNIWAQPQMKNIWAQPQMKNIWAHTHTNKYSCSKPMKQA